MKLIIIRGLPGSGKSTFVRENFKCLHVEADMFFMKDGKYKFDRDGLGFVHRNCHKIVETALSARIDVVVANTFSTMRELKPYLDLAEIHKADVEVYRCEGDFGSIHDVPAETIEKMKERFVDYPGEIMVGGEDAV